jgi:hypothetical protein
VRRLAAAHRTGAPARLTSLALDAYDQRIGSASPARGAIPITSPAVRHQARPNRARLRQSAHGAGAERWDRCPGSLPSTLAAAAGGQEAVLVDRLATRLGQRLLYRLGRGRSEVPERSVRRLEPIETVPRAGIPGPARSACSIRRSVSMG